MKAFTICLIIGVSIPYWLGSKLRDWYYTFYKVLVKVEPSFQSPIGWGLSCECYDGEFLIGCLVSVEFQSPIGWGLSCEPPQERRDLGTGPAHSAFQSPIGWGLSCELGPS
jgi:hypothetical protein